MACHETAYHAQAQTMVAAGLRQLFSIEREDPEVCSISAELQPDGSVLVVLWGSGGEQVGEYAL